MQRSTLRIPVLSQWTSGVERQSWASRIMRLAPIPGCRKACLWCVVS
jgi:hypothetical protein